MRPESPSRRGRHRVFWIQRTGKGSRMKTLMENHLDDRIRVAVEAELQRSSQISEAAQIDVSVTDAIVTLSGVVPTAAEKRAGGLAAWSCPDVRWVQNELQVARTSAN